jgi:hypothetical protein
MTTSTTYGIMDTDYVTDTIIKRFITASDSRIQSWLDDTENDIMEVCKAHGVTETIFYNNVTDNGLNYRIKQYMIAFFCALVCEAVWCTNEVETNDNEIYKIKLDHYTEKYQMIKLELTKEMFSMDEDELSMIDTISGGLLFRG